MGRFVNWLVFIFTAATLVGVFLMLAVVLVFRRLERWQGRRGPLSKNLLRGPGESLRERIDHLRWDVATYFGIAMLPLPLALGFYFAGWAAMGRPPSNIHMTLLILFAVCAEAWLAWKLWKTLKDLRPLRLGYEAETAVGQELNELGRFGCRVFHDFPVNERQFNVDHVVVGPQGIFAIETKGRSKPGEAKEGRTPWEVEYDGDSLRFPGWVEKKPLAQAEAVADWLRDWLSSAVGERVAVQPILVLPGWYVRRTSGKGIPVVSGRQVVSYFTSLRAAPPLTPQLIQRVAHQIEQRCRDVEPRAYAREEKKGLQTTR